jgi:hypothetical protein
MSEIFKQWLKQELNGLVNVRTSVTHQQPDLLVHLWSGVQVRIYLINEQPRLRHLKSLLQEASNIGVGSLFLIHANLIPENNMRTALDEWLLAVHELTYEQVYVYQLEKSKPKLFPIHFEAVAGTAKYEVHHGPMAQLHRLRFYSRHINNMRIIKGKWLVADFDTPAFWKDNDYRHQRMKEQAERRKRDGRDTQWHTWSTGRT